MTAPSPGSTPATDERVLILNYFNPETVLDVLQAADKAGFPETVSTVIGSYGIRYDTAEAANIFERVSYAPLFSIQPGRESVGKLSPYYKARVPASFLPGEWEKTDPAYSGQIPLVGDGVPLPNENEQAWGTELGQRYRDALRANRRAFTIGGWQLDELISQLVLAPPAERTRYTTFVTGVLGGLHLGRPELGDEPEQGIVWASGHAIQTLPAMPAKPLTDFWVQLDQAARLLVGEEYPWFRDDPKATAHLYGSGHHALLDAGPVRKALGTRYVAGFTPGIDNTIDPGLGGRYRNQTTQEALDWKREFVAERATTNPKGFAEFCFLKANADPKIIDATVKTLRDTALTTGK